MTTKADALNTEHLPAYTEFLEQEKELVTSFVKGHRVVADIGGGNGRAVPFLAEYVDRYVLIDNDPNLLTQAASLVEQYPNVTLVQGDAHKASAYKTGPFEASFALFNTVGALENPLRALRQMSRHSKSVFFTVMGRGEGVRELRAEYYEKHGIPYRRNSRDTFFSDVWGPSRGYTLDEAVNLARNAGLRLGDAGTLANLGHYVKGTMYR